LLGEFFISQMNSATPVRRIGATVEKCSALARDFAPDATVH